MNVKFSFKRIRGETLDGSQLKVGTVEGLSFSEKKKRNLFCLKNSFSVQDLNLFVRKILVFFSFLVCLYWLPLFPLFH